MDTKRYNLAPIGFLAYPVNISLYYSTIYNQKKNQIY